LNLIWCRTITDQGISSLKGIRELIIPNYLITDKSLSCLSGIRKLDWRVQFRNEEELYIICINESNINRVYEVSARRPESPYTLFWKKNRTQFKAEHPTLFNFMTIVGSAWANLSLADKQIYIDQATQEGYVVA